MKFLRQFKLFKNSDEQNIHQICKKYKIRNYVINSDGSIDVGGDVDLFKKGLSKLPLKFGKVRGSFYCGNNRLTSLEGCPELVRGNFDCSDNQLKSLEGSPQSVGNDFVCNDNKLITLNGSPQTVRGSFYCVRNQLTSLVGSPQSIEGDFYCNHNNITSFEGFPQSIGKYFNSHDNPIDHIWNLFRDKSLIEYFNEFDCIRGNEVVIDRLNAFLDEIGKPNVESVEGYKNI